MSTDDTDWRPGSFPIATTGGPVEVSGYRRGAFGIDWREPETDGPTGWVLTHIPSGRAAASRLESFRLAAALAARLEPLTDWSQATIDISQEFQERVHQAFDQAYTDVAMGLAPNPPKAD